MELTSHNTSGVDHPAVDVGVPPARISVVDHKVVSRAERDAAWAVGGRGRDLEQAAGERAVRVHELSAQAAVIDIVVVVEAFFEPLRHGEDDVAIEANHTRKRDLFLYLLWCRRGEKLTLWCERNLWKGDGHGL